VACAPTSRPTIHAITRNPHGIAVTLNAPAAFRFTAQACPQRHLWTAQLLGVDTAHARPEDAGQILAGAVGDLMRRTGMPNGLSAVGYGPGDVEQLVAGTLAQQRLTKLSPRAVDAAGLRSVFMDAMTIW